MKLTFLPRFLSKIDKTEDCWPWNSTLFADGYGAFRHKGVTHRAVRMAWKIWNQSEIPEKNVVMHTCDNPLCVRPDHLVLGSQGDNLRDMHFKGRHAKGEQLSNLTESMVADIRNARGTQASIAREFGICQQQVSNIRSRKSWGHV